MWWRGQSRASATRCVGGKKRCYSFRICWGKTCSDEMLERRAVCMPVHMVLREAEEKLMDNSDWVACDITRICVYPISSMRHVFFLSVSGAIDGLHWNFHSLDPCPVLVCPNPPSCHTKYSELTSLLIFFAVYNSKVLATLNWAYPYGKIRL